MKEKGLTLAKRWPVLPASNSNCHSSRVSTRFFSFLWACNSNRQQKHSGISTFHRGARNNFRIWHKFSKVDSKMDIGLDTRGAQQDSAQNQSENVPAIGSQPNATHRQ